MFVLAFANLAFAQSPSCAVPSVGVGTCLEISKCISPYALYPGHCGVRDTECCVYPSDPSKHQPKYYQTWCETNGNISWQTQYLGDIYCQKVFPSSFNREFKCPNRFNAASLAGYGSTSSTLSGIRVNTSALNGIVESDLLVSLILVRRDFNGVPFYKYMSNGNERTVVRTWSSSKVFASANAASTLRQKCNIGLNSKENNKNLPLGDLLTIIHSYDATQGMSSNCLAGYMHGIGGHDKLNRIIHSWVGVPASESLGGNYGGCTPEYGLGDSFTSIPDPSKHCAVSTDPIGSLTNYLSMLSASEMYKRLLMVREEPNNTFPGTIWEDVREILYGPENSVLFPGLQWGGGTSDITWLVQSGVNDIKQIEKAARGQWRIFSKMGSGCETGCDAVTNSYACFPEFDSRGEVLPNRGIEFFISARLNDPTLPGVDQRMHKNIQAIVAKIQDGTLT